MTSPPEQEVTLQSSDTPEERRERGMLRLESKLAQAEAQIRTLQEGFTDLNEAVRRVKQQALYLRIGLLIALLGSFFYLRSL